jgi:sugar lactone lactonase YvrE
MRSRVVPSSEARVLLSGLAFPESPRWRDGRLWVCNWGAQEIVAVDPEGRSEAVLPAPTASLPFSVDWLHDGRMLIVAGREGLLLRRETDGSSATFADLNGISDRGWNEIVVDGRGNIFVNGPGFDMMAGEDFAPGIIALVTPNGSVRQVADGLAFPNGMAVTPDNSMIIVAESYARRLTAFAIDADGALSNRRVWADLGDGCPDGICLDAEGAVWYADVPNKRCVRVREGGKISQTIALDRGGFACTLGGADRRTLFIAAANWRGPETMFDEVRMGQLLTASAPAPGVGWP